MGELLSSKAAERFVFLLLVGFLGQAVGDPATANLPDILVAHNQRRAVHGAPELAWGDDLQQAAQAWADELATGCALVHSQDELGENLYQCSGMVGESCASGANSAVAVDDPAAGWYESEKTWSLTEPSHITQLLWSSSRFVGCAVSSCEPQGEFTSEIVVCKYEPAGNVIGEFEANVPPMPA